MSLILIICLIGFFVLLFSQFGGLISARSAGSWWFVAFFLILATINPDIYRPISDFLGIQFISNFILAGLSLFTIYQLIQFSVHFTDLRRKLRLKVSKDASRLFVERNQFTKSERAKVLVVLPCFNEEASLTALHRELEELKKTTLDWQIEYCFINDGSTDQSEKILKSLGSSVFTSHDVNIGVAGALITGITIARELDCAFLVQCDSDGQHPVYDIPKLLRAAVSEDLDLTIGSRFAESRLQGQSMSTSWLRRCGILLISFCIRGLRWNLVINDPTSGFRVYSRRAMSILLQRAPDDYPEPESIILFAGEGLRIKEIPVNMSQRSRGISSLTGLRSGFYMVKVLSALVGFRLRSLWTR